MLQRSPKIRRETPKFRMVVPPQRAARLFPFCYRPDLSVISPSRPLELELARLLRAICKLTGGRRSFRRRLLKKDQLAVVRRVDVASS
jgi:hypothetical protein